TTAAGSAHAPYLARSRLRRDRGHRGRDRDRGTRQCLSGGPEAESGAGGRSMTRDDDALVAMLLGDAPATPAVRRLLAGDEGRRSRRALAALDALYGDVRVRPVVYWNWLDAPIGRVLVAVGDAGVVRVGFRRSAASFAAALARQLDADVVRSPGRSGEEVGPAP